MSINTAPKLYLPKHHYKLNELSGVIARDIGSDKVNGANTDCTVNQVGNRGKCYLFNGTTSTIDLTLPNIPNGSFCCWFNTNVLSLQTLIGWGESGAANYGRCIVDGVNETGQWANESLTWTHLNIMQCGVIKGLGFYNDGNWHHVAVIMDGNDNRILIDGRKESEFGAVGTATTSGAFMPTAATAAHIGKRTWSGSPLTFDGNIQDVRIFDFGLSDVEVKHIITYGFFQNIQSNPDKKLISWNKLGSVAQVEKGEIGLKFTLAGTPTPTFEDCGFGKGVDSGNVFGTNTGRAETSDYTYLPKGTVEYIWKPSINSADSPTAWWYHFTTENVVSTHYIVFLYDQRSGTKGFGWTIPNAAGTAIDKVIYNVAFTAGTELKIKFVWDADGIDGTNDKRRFYVNGVRQTVTSGSETNSIYSTTVPNLNLSVAGVDIGAGRASAGPISNFKLRNYADTNLKYQEYEYPSVVNGTNIQTTPLKQIVLVNYLNSTENVEDSLIGQNLVEIGTPSYVSDGLQGSLGNYVDTTNFSDFLSIQEGTIDFKFIPKTGFNSNQHFLFDFITDDGGVQHNIRCFMNSGTGLYFQVSVEGVGSAFALSLAGDFTLDVPTRVRCVWRRLGINGTSDTVRMYIDGSLVATNATSAWGATDFGTVYVSQRIGGSSNPVYVSKYTLGIIGELRIRNYASVDLKDISIKEPTNMQEIVTI